MKRRTVIKYSSLTSLLDVLFIMMFASLIQAAALVEKARQQPPSSNQRAAADPDHTRAGSHDAGVGSVADAGVIDGTVATPSLAGDAGATPATATQLLHDKAVVRLTDSLKRRRPIYAHVSAYGVLEVLVYEEAGKGKRLQVSTPLVHRSSDADVEWAYVSNGICALVREHLKLHDLNNELIIIVLEASQDQNDALIRGLTNEPSRCGFNGLLDFEHPTSPPPTKVQP